MLRIVCALGFVLEIAGGCSSNDGSSSRDSGGANEDSLTGGDARLGGQADAWTTSAAAFLGVWKSFRESLKGPCGAEPSEWIPGSAAFAYVTFKIEERYGYMEEYRCTVDTCEGAVAVGGGDFRLTANGWQGSPNRFKESTRPCTSIAETYIIELRGSTLRKTTRSRTAPIAQTDAGCGYEAAAPYTCESEMAYEFERVH